MCIRLELLDVSGRRGRTLIIRISNRTSRSGTTELSLYLTKAEHFTLFSLPNFNFTPEVLDILKQFKDSVVVKTSFGIGIWFKILFRNNFHRIHFRDGTLATRKKYTFVPLFLRVYTCGGHEGLLPKSSCFLKEKNIYICFLILDLSYVSNTGKYFLDSFAFI